MKPSLLIIAFVVCGAHSIPLQHQPTDLIAPERWTVTRDGENNMRLIDLNPIESEPEPAFNPMQDMFFLLFTRSNPTVGQRIGFDVGSVRASNFRPNAGVRFMIHGWGGAALESLENIFTKDAYLARADHNVIIVDWSVGAAGLNYILVRNRVGAVGAVIGQFIDFLHENGFIQLNQVMAVGHSLGAHVAGHAGKNVRRGRIGAIFGTDPAGPLFSVANPDRLAAEDALYTESITTNAGNMGFDEPITHATFYPNWGILQPGCGTDAGCAHERSTFLYAESVNSNLFRARQCTGHSQIVSGNCPGTGVTGLMGGDSIKSLRGVFFLETNSAAPFARG